MATAKSVKCCIVSLPLIWSHLYIQRLQRFQTTTNSVIVVPRFTLFTFAIARSSKSSVSIVIDNVYLQLLEFPEKLIHLGLARMTVSVWDRNKLPSCEIGSIQFRDAVFWKKFLAQPNLTVTEWYTLYAADHDHPRGISPKHKILTLPRKLA